MNYKNNANVYEDFIYTRKYQIKQGDTLLDISRREYNEAFYWIYLWDFNIDLYKQRLISYFILSPNLLMEGEYIYLPSLSRLLLRKPLGDRTYNESKMFLERNNLPLMLRNKLKKFENDKSFDLKKVYNSGIKNPSFSFDLGGLSFELHNPYAKKYKLSGKMEFLFGKIFVEHAGESVSIKHNVGGLNKIEVDQNGNRKNSKSSKKSGIKNWESELSINCENVATMLFNGIDLNVNEISIPPKAEVTFGKLITVSSENGKVFYGITKEFSQKFGDNGGEIKFRVDLKAKLTGPSTYELKGSIGKFSIENGFCNYKENKYKFALKEVGADFHFIVHRDEDSDDLNELKQAVPSPVMNLKDVIFDIDKFNPPNYPGENIIPSTLNKVKDKKTIPSVERIVKIREYKMNVEIDPEFKDELTLLYERKKSFTSAANNKHVYISEYLKEKKLFSSQELVLNPIPYSIYKLSVTGKNESIKNNKEKFSFEIDENLKMALIATVTVVIVGVIIVTLIVAPYAGVPLATSALATVSTL